MAFKDQAFGVHSSTPTCFVSTANALLVGVGTHVRVLDPVSVQSRRSFQAGREPLVTIRALQRTGQVFTATQAGEMAVLDLEQGVVVREQREARVHYAAVSEDGSLAVLCAENSLEVWTITALSLNPTYQIAGNFQLCEFTPSKRLFSMSTACPDTLQCTAFLHCQLGQVAQAALPFAGARLGTCKTSGEQAVLLFTDRRIAVVAVETLQVVKLLTIQGTGPIGTVGLEGNLLCFIPQRGVFTVVSLNEVEMNGEIDPLCDKIAPGVVSVKTSYDLLSQEALFLQWTQPYLALASDNGIYRFEFPTFPLNRLSYASSTLHQAGCTALCLNVSASRLCSGDDTGQVLVWNVLTAALLCSFQTVSRS